MIDFDNLPRNRLGIADKISTFLAILPAPALIAWALIKSNFTEYGKARSAKRVIIDRVTLRLCSALNRRQIRAFFGPTTKVYDDYVKAKKLPSVVEEIGGDAKLLWLGPNENLQRVILYIHGGAFVFGAVGSAPAFFAHVQSELQKRGKATSVAILDYTLVPDKPFPTQVHQTILAIQHLVNSGVKPQNIQLVVDSAGGTIIHEAFSHLLHPIPSVPQLKLSTPLAGAYLMSPWTRINDTADQVLKTDREGKGDFLTRKTGLYWASKIMEGMSQKDLPYTHPNTAPADWLKGVDKYVKRIFISAGGAEILRDEIIKYTELVKPHHRDVTVYIQDYGIHTDPFFDFLAEEKNLGKLTPKIVDFLDAGFA